MPRLTRIRPALRETQIITDNDIEVARLTAADILVLNEPAIYMWLVKNANRTGFAVPATIIYRKFGLTGGWSTDPFVYTLLEKFDDLNLTTSTRDSAGNIITVRPRSTPKRALEVLDPYITRAEMMAQLEEADE